MRDWYTKAKILKIYKYLKKGIDTVITVYDNAKDTCPNFPNVEVNIHWSIKGPFHSWNVHEKDLKPYRIARNEIKARIKALLQKNKKKNL